MIQILIIFTTVLCLNTIKATEIREKRGSFSSAYSYSAEPTHIGLGEPLSLPLHETQLYSLGIDSFLPIPQGSSLSISKVNIVPVAQSNSVEKPVEEPSDGPQQPSRGTAVIPLQPPPAVPVIAAAANVPASNGAVFLGSGGLGVINLGNGAFALGSGGIGYSNIRQQPRPNGLSPLYPPLAASPNLVPAATASQQPAPLPQADLSSQLSPGGYQFDQPLFEPNAPRKPVDRNGYERLDASAAGFGSPSPRVRPLKTRNNYATPTLPQLQVETVHSSQLPLPGFGEPIPRLPAAAVRYKY